MPPSAAPDTLDEFAAAPAEAIQIAAEFRAEEAAPGAPPTLLPAVAPGAPLKPLLIADPDQFALADRRLAWLKPRIAKGREAFKETIETAHRAHKAALALLNRVIGGHEAEAKWISDGMNDYARRAAEAKRQAEAEAARKAEAARQEAARIAAAAEAERVRKEEAEKAEADRIAREAAEEQRRKDAEALAAQVAAVDAKAAEELRAKEAADAAARAEADRKATAEAEERAAREAAEAAERARLAQLAVPTSVFQAPTAAVDKPTETRQTMRLKASMKGFVEKDGKYRLSETEPELALGRIKMLCAAVASGVVSPLAVVPNFPWLNKRATEVGQPGQLFPGVEVVEDFNFAGRGR